MRAACNHNARLWQLDIRSDWFNTKDRTGTKDFLSKIIPILRLSRQMLVGNQTLPNQITSLGLWPVGRRRFILMPKMHYRRSLSFLLLWARTHEEIGLVSSRKGWDGERIKLQSHKFIKHRPTCVLYMTTMMLVSNSWHQSVDMQLYRGGIRLYVLWNSPESTKMRNNQRLILVPDKYRGFQGRSIIKLILLFQKIVKRIPHLSSSMC
jgi:hypothetical protein